ncbi:MAG: AraC family transcriptional regulator [Cytophagaceae bacterium]|nr:AraC family transcriptional regulator [Cytophagaceae bacterium]
MISQKPQLLKVPEHLDYSFVVKGDAIAWDNPWHYHPEVELLYCIKGKGTNFVGNCIRSIEEGEVLLLGKNLPHTRQRDRVHYLANPESPETVVVQFNEDFLGKEFLSVKEFQPIGTLLERAQRGLTFYGETRLAVAERLLGLAALSGTNRVLALLTILDCLGRSSEVEYLNPAGYVSTAHEKSSEKINRVYEYTINHFREAISLAEVAALTNLSVSAFCRYFKLRTRKSYFQYLTEVRVGFACKLLTEGELDIGPVCYASGFNNLSHFHRQFKKIVNLTPKEYEQRSQGKIPA